MSGIIKAMTRPKEVSLMLFDGNNLEEILDFIGLQGTIKNVITTTEFDYSHLDSDFKRTIVEVEYTCRPYPVLDFDGVKTKSTKRLTIKQGYYVVNNCEDFSFVTKYDASELYSNEIFDKYYEEIIENLKDEEKTNPDKFEKIVEDQQKAYDEAAESNKD